MRTLSLSMRPVYALVLLIMLAPFQAFLRIAFPESTVVLLWRDALAYGLVVVCLARAVIRDVKLPRHWINGVLIVYIAWGLLKIFVPPSANMMVGLYGFRAAVRYAPLYFATLLIIRNERDVRLLSKATLVGPTVLALFGIWQFLAPETSVFQMGSDFAPTERFGQRSMFGVYFPRIDSIYMAGVNGFAVYMTSCVGLSLYALLSRPEGRRRLSYWVVAGSLIFVILFSFSRVAWVGLVVTSFLILRKRRPGRLMSRWRPGRLMSGLIMLIVSAPLLYAMFSPEWSDPFFIQNTLWRLVDRSQAFPIDPDVLLFGEAYAFSGYTEGVPEALLANVLESGGLDSQWLLSVLQFGLVGALLQVIILIGFIAVAYRMHRQDIHSVNVVQPGGLIWHPTPLLGTFLFVALSSSFTAPFSYQGLDVNFYVLGAIAVWYYRHYRVLRNASDGDRGGLKTPAETN